MVSALPTSPLPSRPIEGKETFKTALMTFVTILEGPYVMVNAAVGGYLHGIGEWTNESETAEDA